MYRILILSALIMCMPAISLFSQFEFNNWYFGYGAGITFNTPDGSPVSLIDGKDFEQLEGCASISDNKGEFILYSNGREVWNKNHTLIASGLMGYLSYTSVQAAQLIPKPGDSNIYYLFMTDQTEASVPKKGSAYATIDISMNGGQGGLSMPWQFLFSPATEKQTVARHANGKDYWVIMHGLSNDTFNVYAVTENGVSATPVQSKAGMIHDSIVYMDGGGYNGSFGDMKVSLQGDRLALSNAFISLVEYFDFDNSTGVVSNPRTLHLDSIHFPNTITYNIYVHQNYPYSVVFSPDGTKLYVSNEYRDIIQFDLSLNDVNEILDSAIQIANLDLRFGMQTGPDGKIYISVKDSSHLDAIEKPNVKGTGCSYKPHAVNLKTGLCGSGLPNIVYPSRIITTLTADDVCEGEIIALHSKTNHPDVNYNFLWDGPNGFVSNQQNPFILNASTDMSGWYYLTISYLYYKQRDSIYVIVLPKPVIKPNQTKIDFARLCTGEEAQTDIVLYNEGSEEIIIEGIEIKNGTPAYSLSPVPLSIKQEEIVNIKFSPNETGYYIDTLVIRASSNLCQDTIFVEIKGIATAKVRASIPEITASINDNISIPLYMDLVCGESLPPDAAYEARIIYDAAALNPDLIQEEEVSVGKIINHNRIVTITGNGLESKSFKGTVMMSYNDETPIRFESIEYNNELIETDTSSGRLKATGICVRHLSHIQLLNSIALTVAPLPANEEAEIIISGDKSGKVILSVYSVGGIKVEEMEISKTTREISRRINLKKYGAGVYQVTAAMDGNVSVDRLVVVK